MEKLFENYKGVVLFYVIIAILSFVFTLRIDNLNSQAQNEETKINETVYA